MNFYTQIPRAVELTGARKRSWGELNGIYTRVAGKLCNGKAVYQASAGDNVLFQASGTPQWWVSSSDNAASCEASGYIHTWGLVCDARPDCAGRWRESEGCAWGEEWCDAHGLAVREAQCAEVCGAHGTLVANAATCECSCRDGFSGPRCELAPAYSISGARSSRELNGIYTRVAGKLCSGKPVYQKITGDYVLFHATNYSCWIVGTDFDCHFHPYIISPTAVCEASPDGCDGRWREPMGDDSVWCDSPDLVVGPADAAAVAAAVEEAASEDIVVAAFGAIVHWLGVLVYLKGGAGCSWSTIGGWVLIFLAYVAVSDAIEDLDSGIGLWALFALNYVGAFYTIDWLIHKRGLRCLTGDALAAEFAKAAAQIALTGPTPHNLQANVLGIFLKRKELVNGYPSYTKAGDDSAMLWHAGSCWYIGPAALLGWNRGVVSAIDGCLRPEDASATWRVSNGRCTFIDAPELRCLAGDALAAEIAKAAPQIALTGPTPHNLHAHVLGTFLKRKELVNGYPSYTKAGDDSAMLWHAGPCWYLGQAALLGWNRGVVSAFDGCLPQLPHGASPTVKLLSTLRSCAASRATLLVLPATPKFTTIHLPRYKCQVLWVAGIIDLSLRRTYGHEQSHTNAACLLRQHTGTE